jgi:ornithine cyclodeaminase
VVELMPISDADRFAFKYVNGHPGNARAGLLTVAAFGVLADMVTGYPRLVAEMTAPARPSCSARSCCAQASSSNSKSRRGSRASCNRCPPTFR